MAHSPHGAVMNRYDDRVIRGGDWQNVGNGYLTTTFRTDLPSDQHPDMGFRTVLNHRQKRQ